MANNTEIIELFAMLEGAGVNHPKPWGRLKMADIIETWCGLLYDAPGDQLLVAARNYLRNGGEFWPKPGQLLQLIPESGPPMLGWARIWDRLCTGLFRQGRRNPPGRVDGWRLAERDDENDAAMVAMGGENGWRRLCMSEEAKLGFEARTFERTFSAQLKTATAARRWIAASAPLQLTDTEAPS